MTEKEAIQYKLEWYKKLKVKIEKILRAEMSIEQYNDEVGKKIKKLEEALSTFSD